MTAVRPRLQTQALEQGFQCWDDFEQGYDYGLAPRIWRCGPCNRAYFRRARIIEALEDGDYVPPTSTAGGAA